MLGESNIDQKNFAKYQLYTLTNLYRDHSFLVRAQNFSKK